MIGNNQHLFDCSLALTALLDHPVYYSLENLLRVTNVQEVS